MRALWLAAAFAAFAHAYAQQPVAAAAARQPDSKADAEPAARRPPLDAPDKLEPAVHFDAAARARTPAKGKRTAPATPPRAASVRRRGARDTLDLGTTSITGNQELPKVLYIVPWKQSDLGDVVGRPANTLLDDVLAPLDPAVFERRLKYYETLHGTKEKE